MNHEPRDPNFRQRIEQSFARQTLMTTLGATLHSMEPGKVVIRLPHQEHICQQHGFLHAGAIASVVDSACGYAALTLAEPATAVLAVEFKINLMKPAVGEEFYAAGTVVRAGKTLTVCSGEFYTSSTADPIALMQSTIMTLANRPDLAD